MRCCAYTDGSYSVARNPITGEDIGVYGSGIFLQLEGYALPIRLNLAGFDVSWAKMRNVAGELQAVIYLMDQLDKELPEYTSVDIYYDYEGVEKWVTGEWKANKVETRAYRDVMREYQKKFTINFSHVKAHSGVFQNEEADALAKEGIKKACAEKGFILNE